jgi:O-antigen/teichoic acid export membrane protein
MSGGGGRPDTAEYESYLSKATKEAGFTFFGQAFSLVFGFLASAVVARFLGADVLGVFVLAWTVVMAASVLTTFGLEGGFVRFISMYVGQGKRAEARSVVSLGISFGVAAGLAGTGAIILLRGPLANTVFKEPRLESALVLIAFSMVPFTLSRLHGAALRGLKDMRRYIIGVELWRRVSRLVLFLVLFYLGFRLTGIVVAAVISCVASAVATAWLVRRSGRFLFERKARAPIPRRGFMTYSSQMLAETATAFALVHSGKLVLGFFLPSADVGVYNVVALLAGLATLFTFSFNAIFSPMIAEVFHRGNVELMKSLLHAITRWIILLTLPAFAWLLVSGEAVLSLFGSEFVRGYAALAVLTTAQVIDSTAGSVSSCLAMTKYQRYNVYNILVMAVVSIGLNIYLVPRLGILGVAIATGTAIVLVNAARLTEGKLLLNVWPFDRSSLKIAAVAVALLGLTLAARRWFSIPPNWYWSATSLVACYGVAAGMVFLLGFEREDRVVWSAVLAKLKRRSP